MFTAHRTLTRHGRTMLAASAMLVALAAPAGAQADTISLTSTDSWPTVGDPSPYEIEARAYSDSTAEVYLRARGTACPASAEDADASSMHRTYTGPVDGDGALHTIADDYTAPHDDDYLFCAYLFRDDPDVTRGSASMVVDFEDEEDAPVVTIASSQELTTANTVTADVSCPRACDLVITGTAGTSSAMDVTLGSATAAIGTFGGSATVQLTMSDAQRRRLRSRMASGQRVRADLLATADYANGRSFDTSATTQLVAPTLSVAITPATVVFRGA
jgi:hypothetical protein